MAYVKSGNPGKITMDLPRSSYIYELPLLSFGDYHGKLDLSLIFNYQMKYGGDNSFCIKEGYKLNVQKQLIFKDGVPESLQEANGNCTDLIGVDFPYAFDDDSMRILRRSTSAALPYTIENEDYSKELYDAQGRLMSVIDKYGRTILSYTYIGTQNKLLRLVFHANYIIEFMYTNDCLTSFKYKNANCTTELACTDTGITVTHYSGETYNLTFSNAMDFSAATSSASYTTKLEKTADTTLVISNMIGDEVVDTMTYTFPDAVGNSFAESNHVEVTNYEGVKTRMQYQGDQLVCSYEVSGDDVSFLGDKFAGTVQIYKTMEDSYNTLAFGALNHNDGIRMLHPFETEWKYDVSSVPDVGINGYFVLTGWMRRVSNMVATGDTKISILTNYVDGSKTDFYPDADLPDQWTFFAYKFYADVNYLQVTVPDPEYLETKDLRFTYQQTRMIVDDATSKIAVCGPVLIHHSENETTYIPMEECEFIYDEENISADNTVTLQDLLRYKVNQNKGVRSGEVYRNGCREVLSLGSDSFIVKHTNPATKDVTEYDLDACNLGMRQYVGNNMVTTEIKTETNNRLVYETRDKEGMVIAYKKLNAYQDVIEESSEGVTTTYTRNYDLVFAVNVTDGDSAYTKQTTYSTDDSGNLLITETDEFGGKTEYILDPIWGTVKSVTLPDENVVADTYDDDCCALTNRAFDGESTRSNTIGYSGGNVSSLESGYLSYGFTYTKGKLTAVTKNGTKIEEHTHTGNTRVKSFYPNKTNTLHSIDATYDMYGRLTSITGVLSNVYDISPTFDADGTLSDIDDNKDALLAKTTDHVLGEVARFTYHPNGTLKNKEVTSSSAYSDQISTETFTYDAINRLTEDECTYNFPANRKVTSTIVYATTHDNPHADQRVATYTYAVGSANAAVTTNAFDAFKRVTSKTYTIGSRTFTKSFGYNATRVETVEDSVGGVTTYTYDVCGRLKTVTTGGKTTTYHYDAYGQLVREDNQSLDKTLVYDYSSNTGNLLRVKQYAYTTAATLGDSYTKISYGYTRDQINSYSGTAITNNTMGCPSTHGDMNLTWTKGKLSKAFSGSRPSGIGTYEYGYNAYGQRVSKSFSFLEGSDVQPQTGQLTGMEKQYFYDHAGRLIAEETSSTFYESAATTERIVFLYDESGIIGMRRTLNGTTSYYYFKRNLLGDVTAIYNSSGTMVAKYLYDAYGNCTYSGTTSIALANPIRYRGYYYDDETGLYYCNARYYSPKWRRFISPDDTAYLDPESVNGLNLYCYCGNDPVNYADPSGSSAIVIGAIIGAVLGFGAAAYIDYRDDGQIFNGSVAWYDYLGATLTGGAIGAGIAYCLPAISSFAGSSFSFGGGAAMLLDGTAVAISGITVTGTQILITIGTLALGNIMLFASNNRPGNNGAQNKQYKAAARKAGYNPNDPKVKDALEEVHQYIRKNHLNIGFKTLVELIKEFLD